MTNFDLTTISTTASTVAIVMGGFLWLASRVFDLGKTLHRLDTIETDLTAFKQDIHEQFKGVHHEISALDTRMDCRIDILNQRMDKLILAISQSHQPPIDPNSHGHN